MPCLLSNMEDDGVESSRLGRFDDPGLHTHRLDADRFSRGVYPSRILCSPDFSGPMVVG